MSMAKISNIGGGIKLADINSEKVLTDDFLFKITSSYLSLPVNGYSKISFARKKNSDNITCTYRFLLSDGTYSAESTFTTNTTTWVPVNIPSNALLIQIKFSSSYNIWFALEV